MRVMIAKIHEGGAASINKLLEMIGRKERKEKSKRDNIQGYINGISIE